MTEPTQAQIEEAKQMRARYPSRVSLDVYTNELASIIAHIRREARNAALEEAAKICKREEELMASAGMKHPEDSHSRDRCFARSRTAGALYNAIRALKDQP